MSGQQESQQSHAQPTLCAGGCGFYSNGTNTGGLCSKCWREQQQQADKALELSKQASTASGVPPPAPSQDAPEAPQRAEVAVAGPSAPAVEAPAAPASAPAVGAPAATAPAPANKPSPTRCLTCNKKVGLTGFTCKCQSDAVFCSLHRHAEAHACTWDWKANQRAALAAANPVVQASKIQKL